MPSPSAPQPQAAVRVTRQRRAVQAAMAVQADFVSTQDLHAILRERGESVSLATTYRILQSMAEAGEVDVLRSEDGESIYRQCAAEQHHHHLVCRRCGATVELQALEMTVMRVIANEKRRGNTPDPATSASTTPGRRRCGRQLASVICRRTTSQSTRSHTASNLPSLTR